MMVHLVSQIFKGALLINFDGAKVQIIIRTKQECVISILMKMICRLKLINKQSFDICESNRVLY